MSPSAPTLQQHLHLARVRHHLLRMRSELACKSRPYLCALSMQPPTQCPSNQEITVVNRLSRSWCLTGVQYTDLHLTVHLNYIVDDLLSLSICLFILKFIFFEWFCCLYVTTNADVNVICQLIFVFSNARFQYYYICWIMFCVFIYC